MQLIKGKEIADNILNNIKSQIDKLEAKPTLAVVLIGEDKASEIYVNLKEKAAQGIGMNFLLFKYDANIAEGVILDKIAELNNDKNVNGIIVQLPLPERLDKSKIINAILPQKDVDGFCGINQECFFNDRETLYPVFPKAIMKMVEFALGDLGIKDGTPSVLADISPFGKGGEGSVEKAVIVCRSDDFGKMMQKAFSKIGIETGYFFCSDIDDNKEILNQADIVITACGERRLINSKMIKDSAIIIDGGIVKEDGRVFGDVDMESFNKTNCLISPVPGGVGPVTVACLLENVYLAFCGFENNKN